MTLDLNNPADARKFVRTFDGNALAAEFASDEDVLRLAVQLFVYKPLEGDKHGGYVVLH